MCGIFCSISKGDSEDCPKRCVDLYRRNVQRRGPDHTGETHITTGSGHTVSFLASVLWTQGETVTRQPIETERSILLFNGDIFSGLDDSARSKLGDTTLVMDVLEKSRERLGSLQGPFAFIFYDKSAEELYFGRDQFGRVSLLIGDSEGAVVMTSVATQVEGAQFTDVPSVGVFCLNLRTNVLSLMPYDVTCDLSRHLERLEDVLERRVIVEKSGTIPPNYLKNVMTEPFNGIDTSNPDGLFEQLLMSPIWYDRVRRLETLLTDSVRRRTTGLPDRCRDCSVPCAHCTVGVLFSGGVDCSVLALLADMSVDASRPIDLINVSFREEFRYESPDRSTGRGTLEELRELRPDREWRFLEVDVSRSELAEQREREIADLVYPLNTVLDDSLGCALWFAGRGRTAGGTSSCRILLVGTGADELFGGYTKHRIAFKRDSWSGLKESLDADWRDLPHRNLGRDNRVICDHGRQMRTPYLDEGVVGFVRALPCWEKLFPTDELPKGIGDKLLLRLLAYHLGLKSASRLQKRALQFGSRIANRNENAHEVCQRLIRIKPGDKVAS